MKLLVLIASCIPLTVLTVWSFVELGSLDDELACPPQPEVQEQIPSVDQVEDLLAAEKPLVEGLAEADLLAAQPMAALQTAEAAGPLKAVARSWPAWVRARAMVGGVLAAEQSAVAAGIEQLEQARREYDSLLAQYRQTPPRSSGRLLEVIDRRRADVEARILRHQRRREAIAVLARAGSAFESGDYLSCVELCDRLLTEYIEAVDATDLAEVRVLRWRARFWGDAEQLRRQSQEAQTPSRHLALLQGFLNKYSNGQGRTESELRLLTTYDQQVGELIEQVAEAKRTEAGMARVEQLHRELPEDPLERIARAAEIIDEHPTAAVQKRIRSEVLGWLSESVPQKRIEEPPLLREVLTKDNAVVRGFFKEFTEGGRIVGYKCYPTHEQLVRPVAAVGIYRVELLLGPPAESVPRRCVTRYNRTRKQLLARPDDKQAWNDLALLCDDLQAEIRQYLKRPGSSQEQISFAEQAKLVRRVVDGPGWDALQKVFRR